MVEAKWRFSPASIWAPSNSTSPTRGPASPTRSWRTPSGASAAPIRRAPATARASAWPSSTPSPPSIGAGPSPRTARAEGRTSGSHSPSPLPRAPHLRPRTRPTPDPPNSGVPPAVGATVSAMNAVAHVLVVEDDADLRGVLRRGLERSGFQVTLTPTATEALDSVSQEPPDVLVVDVGLPDADGRDLCQA